MSFAWRFNDSGFNTKLQSVLEIIWKWRIKWDEVIFAHLSNEMRRTSNMSEYHFQIIQLHAFHIFSKAGNIAGNHVTIFTLAIQNSSSKTSISVSELTKIICLSAETFYMYLLLIVNRRSLLSVCVVVIWVLPWKKWNEVYSVDESFYASNNL